MSRTRPTTSILAAIERKGRPIDVLGLAAVPAVLVALFALPGPVKRRLALEFAEPTLLTAFASHYVHLSAAHLLTNVVGYVLVVPLAYLLATAAGRREQFWVVFTVFVLALPFGLSGVTVLVQHSTAGSGVGFSGIVMAFLGYLPITMTSLLGHRTDSQIDGSHSAWLFFTGIAIIAYAAAPGWYGVALAAAALLSAVLFLLPVIEIARSEAGSFRPSLRRPGTIEFLASGVVIYLAYPLVTFPQDLLAFDGRINTYVHALGFCLGYTITYVAILVGVFAD